MIFPSEIIAKYFIPTLRYMLAKELEKKDLTEETIASKLSISQSAVSKYRGNKLRVERTFLDDERLKAKVNTVALGLAENRITKFQALAEFMPLIYEYENRGKICELHEKVMPELMGLNCDLCVRLAKSEVLEEQEILSNIRQAVRVLESVPGFARFIPNVGSNIAMAKRGGKDLSEVAAIPGRIYEVKGVVKVPAPPEFGASKHVAEVVLAVHEIDPGKRAAMNIAHNDEIIGVCKVLNLKILEIQAKHEGRRKRIQKALSEGEVIPDVIYHRGDYGIEPITYLLGSDAVNVSEIVGKVLEYLRSGME